MLLKVAVRYLLIKMSMCIWLQSIDILQEAMVRLLSNVIDVPATWLYLFFLPIPSTLNYNRNQVQYELQRKNEAEQGKAALVS